MTDHISDLQWDRLLAGELPPAIADARRAHAAGCPACAARLAALTAERDAFHARPLPPGLRPPVEVSSRRRWRWALALVPAAAAVVLLLLGRERHVPSEQVKGSGPALLLSAGPPDALVPVATGDTVRPGEHLQAGYTAERDGFGAVLSRDGVGEVTVYVPADDTVMVSLPGGVERSFPQSTILDEVVGSERIAIVWCEAAHPLAPLLAALRAGIPLVAPAGCTIREVVLEKRAGPP